MCHEIVVCPIKGVAWCTSPGLIKCIAYSILFRLFCWDVVSVANAMTVCLQVFIGRSTHHNVINTSVQRLLREWCAPVLITGRDINEARVTASVLDRVLPCVCSKFGGSPLTALLLETVSCSIVHSHPTYNSYLSFVSTS